VFKYCNTSRTQICRSSNTITSYVFWFCVITLFYLINWNVSDKSRHHTQLAYTMLPLICRDVQDKTYFNSLTSLIFMLKPIISAFSTKQASYNGFQRHTLPWVSSGAFSTKCVCVCVCVCYNMPNVK